MAYYTGLQKGEVHQDQIQKMIPLEVEQYLHCHQVKAEVLPEPSESEAIIKPTFQSHPKYKYQLQIYR